MLVRKRIAGYTPADLLEVIKREQAQALLKDLEASSDVKWRPVDDNYNNQGKIQMSARPENALAERASNGVDTKIECVIEDGLADGCTSPREVAERHFPPHSAQSPIDYDNPHIELALVGGQKP